MPQNILWMSQWSQVTSSPRHHQKTYNLWFQGEQKLICFKTFDIRSEICRQFFTESLKRVTRKINPTNFDAEKFHLLLTEKQFFYKKPLVRKTTKKKKWCVNFLKRLLHALDYKNWLKYFYMHIVSKFCSWLICLILEPKFGDDR